MIEYGEIRLTKGMTATVDAKDFDHISRFNWHYNTEGYAVRTVDHSGKISMHRQIMGDKKGYVIDHKNGNGLDNRRANLRYATHTQNMQNRKLQKNNSTGYRGVSYIKSKRHFRASIRNNGKPIIIGQYRTAEEAAIAYNKSARIYHGEFAKLNNIKGD